jgi:pimeloyl-ACP methyl ester carboxylesterase
VNVHGVTLLLLPGLDGGGDLFGPFIRSLPDRVGVKVLAYPHDIYLTYERLADRVREAIPGGEPYVIVAESYSGPVAIELAALPERQLRAVVLVASFAARPLGWLGEFLARLPLTTLLRIPPPRWGLRWLLADAAAPAQLVAEIRNAVQSVPRPVLAARIRQALRADHVGALARCRVPLICLLPQQDRLLGLRCTRAFERAPISPRLVPLAGPHLLLQCRPEGAVAALEKLGLFD